MLQFKPVFIVFLIFQIVLMVIDIVKRFQDTVVQNVINGKTYEHTVKNNLSAFIKILLIILAILNVIILVSFICFFLLKLYYFFLKVI